MPSQPEPDQFGSSAGTRVSTLLQWVLLAILIARSLFFLVYSIQTILFPFPVDYDEGVILHSTLLLVRGETLYQPLQTGQFVSSVYTPLFYLLAAPLVRLAGATLVPGRILAFLTSLGSVTLLAALARLLGSGRWSALPTALMPLSFGTTLIWSTLAKPDTPSLFFGLLTLYWVVRYRDDTRVYWATLWFALGFFTKQNTPLLAGIAVLYLLLHTPTRGLLLGLYSSIAAAGPFFLLNWLTQGNLLLHTFGFQRLPWDGEHMWHMIEAILVFLPGLTLLALLSVVFLVRRRRRQTLAVLFLLLGGLLFLATGGRIGTNWSFQLPLLFAMALCTCLLLFSEEPLIQSPHARVALLGLAVLQFILMPSPVRWYNPDLQPSPERREALETACAVLRGTPAPILSEDIGLLLLCGHEPLYDDPFMMAQLARAGLWDESTFVRQLEEEHFTLVVLVFDVAQVPPGTRTVRWTEATLGAIREHYILWQQEGVFIHRPQGRPAGQGLEPDSSLESSLKSKSNLRRDSPCCVR